MSDDAVAYMPRQVFAQRLATLIEAAGNPRLDRVAAAANAAAPAARVTADGLADWMSGVGVPARVEALVAVVLALLEPARTAGAPASLYRLSDWKQLWEAATRWEAQADSVQMVCPYPGLEPYRRDDAELFCGRAAVTKELVDLVRGALTAGGRGGVVAVVGPAGAGKTSLLSAGLVPALAHPADEWSVIELTPGPDPVGVPAAVVARGRRRLVLVDRFEELFTVCADERARRAFVAHLAGLAAESATAVVIAVRAEHYPRCRDYPELTDALRGHSLALGPMRHDELVEFVSRPAELAGLTLESGLAEVILAELAALVRADGPAGVVGAAGGLPLLSHAMAATWQRREGWRLTADGYRAGGGVAGSVARSAEQAWADFSGSERGAAERVLRTLVTIGPDGRPAGRAVARAGLPAGPDAVDIAAVVARLSRAGLVAVAEDRVAVVQDVVIAAWPRLRAWAEATPPAGRPGRRRGLGLRRRR